MTGPCGDMSPRPRGSGALRLLLLGGVVALSSSCTHTRSLDPAGPAASWTAAQTALSGRQARVATAEGDNLSIRDVVLRSASLEGTRTSDHRPVAVPLGGVRSIEYRSRRRGAWDWLLIGLAVNAAGISAIMSQEAGSDPEWALVPLVVVSATIPYVVFGTIRGSTIRFLVRAGG